MKTMYVFALAAGLVILDGSILSCRHPEPSPIVTVFESAGGSDVKHATPGGISAFLTRHEDLRKQLTPLCQQRQASAPADWPTTDEGKVCAGNRSASFFGKTTLKSDGVAF